MSEENKTATRVFSWQWSLSRLAIIGVPTAILAALMPVHSLIIGTVGGLLLSAVYGFSTGWDWNNPECCGAEDRKFIKGLLLAVFALNIVVSISQQVLLGMGSLFLLAVLPGFYVGLAARGLRKN